MIGNHGGAGWEHEVVVDQGRSPDGARPRIQAAALWPAAYLLRPSAQTLTFTFSGAIVSMAPAHLLERQGLMQGMLAQPRPRACTHFRLWP